MKTKLTRLQISIVCALSLFLGALTIVPTGCNTVGTAAYKVESVAIPTVDAAMKIWSDWVKAGKATQAQVDAVKGYYTSYYNAQIVLKQKLEDYISTASSTNAAPVQSAALTAAGTAATSTATTLTTAIAAITKGK